MSANADAKKAPVTAILAAMIIVAALAVRGYDAWKSHHPVLATATLKGKIFTLEIANTDAKKELGLGKRDRLAADQGMYFPFAAAQYWVFWMKDMRFPIDIIWLRDGRVVSIDQNVPVVPAGQPLATYTPSDPADAVLEVNAGTSAELGLSRGDALSLKPQP